MPKVKYRLIAEYTVGYPYALWTRTMRSAKAIVRETAACAASLEGPNGRRWEYTERHGWRERR